MSELITWTGEPPALRDPVLLVSLEGFVDAGAVAGTASLFLRHRWLAEQVAVFDRDSFIDYRARRPTAIVDGGELRRVEWPELEVLTATVDGPHDAVFLLGPEPDMRWGAFFDEVVALCRRLGVTECIGLGAYPAAVPHTRPVQILKAANPVGGRLQPEAGSIAGYTGPVGAGTALHDALGRAGIPSVGLWAEVAHYIAGSPNPGAALAMVQLVATTMGTTVDTTELEAAAKLHREQVDEAVAEHPDAAEMVRTLEQHVDVGGSEDLPTGEAMAAEIERFLRNQSPEG
jgi:proteasome assembly chaperone (PAC2) family protein